MKGLKKLALAAAVAAAPFAAQADLKALDDTSMSNVTGQAGVTIELQTQVSIGQFSYTDEGSFNVNNIELGGAGVTDSGSTAGYNNLLDQLKIDIDVADDGDAIIHVGSLQTDPTTGAPVPIDWGMTAESMTLTAGATGTDSTTLVSGLQAWGNLAKLDISVDTATDHLNVAAAFDIQDMDFDVPFLAVGIRDMKVTGAGDNFDYDGDGMVASADTDGEFGLTDPLKLGVLEGFANVDLDVYKGNGLGASSPTDVLRVDVKSVNMDVSVGSVLVGGTSIGSIAMDNVAITKTKLAVYGH